jgi:ATP-binding cassette subfamily F protein uup
MRAEQGERRAQQGKVKISVESGARSGKLVIEAKHISFSYGDTTIFQDFSTLILRGDKIGLVGPNGIGKTTLLNALLEKLQPDSGTVRMGTNLEVAYFDQLREQLNPNQTIIDCVGDGVEMITIGKRTVHIMTYLQEFLFSPKRARQPISSLSGGEKNRVLLAKLFTKPANLLVLDEPTNDLDVETLEILEDLLVRFEGTVLLVSHDRTFLDNVVTSTIVFEAQGVINEYVGGYSDWLRQRRVIQPATAKQQSNSTSQPKKAQASNKKLSYKQQQQLDALPTTIAALETQQSEIHDQISDANFYSGDQQQINKVLADSTQIEQQLEQAYADWEALETQMESYAASE